MSLQDQEMLERQVKALEWIRFTLSLIFFSLVTIAAALIGLFWAVSAVAHLFGK